MDATCKVCGNPVSRPSGQYCSQRCMGLAKRKRILLHCAVCQKPFELPECHASLYRCCSRKCKAIHLRRIRQSEIEQQVGIPIKAFLEKEYASGKGIKKIAREIGVSDHTLWTWFDDLGIDRRDRSDAVKTQWINNDNRRSLSARVMRAITDTMKAQGRENNAKRPEVRDKISESKKGEKNAMYGKFGEQHHSWKGGKITYRGAGWKSIMAQARRRDGERCVKCGSTKQLEVHHIVPYRFTQDNSLENLITLCHICHIQAEKGSYSLRTWKAKLRQLKLF